MPDAPDRCASWDEDLSALIDGELAPPREAEVRAHVEGCERCGTRLAELRRVDTLLAAAPLPEVPESLREATRARVAQPPPRAGAARPPAVRRAPPRRERSLRAPAIGVAAAAAAALALYLLGRPGPDVVIPGTPEPPVAQIPDPAPAPDTPPDEPPPIQIVEPLPPPPLPPPPEPEIPRFVPELAPPEPLIVDLETEPAEDLAVVLFGAERPDDFDVIANLEILERLLELEGSRG